MKKIKEIFNKFKNFNPEELEILLAEILRRDKSFVFSHPEYKLSLAQYLKLIYFIYQRKTGFSVAAIIKHKEFYKLDFYVNKDVLIPRPDTELMVIEAIDEIKKTNEKIVLIDIGTGSGCIPIAILKNLPQPVEAYAMDISKKALTVAKKNAKIHNVNIKFLRGNLLEPIVHNSKLLIHNSKIIITANLPYLTEKQFQQEQSIQKEPKIALVAKTNGLALYEELLRQIKLTDLNATIFLEIDPSQSEKIIKIIKQHLPDSNIEIKKDLAELDRLVIVRS